MDLAFHFYPFTELGCSKITWLLKWFSTIQCPLNFLNFASVARSSEWPLSSTKCYWPQIERNIFRVAFLSCSHIRLEMFFEACRAGLHWCCRFVFLKRDNFYNISQLFASVNNFFNYFFKSFSEALQHVILGDKKMKRIRWIVFDRSISFLRAEKAGFEPARRFPDLHP